MRILGVCHSLSGNNLSRVAVLERIIEHLGWELKVTGPAPHGLWPPIRDMSLASRCRVAEVPSDDELAWADLLLAFKVYEKSLGVALWKADEHRLPVLLDVDDADWEAHAPGRLRREIRLAPTSIRHQRLPFREHLLRVRAQRTPSIASNPILAKRYAATVVPHVPLATSDRAPTSSAATLRIGFVGTPRPHKGIGVLREAVANVEQVSLTVTGVPPSDPQVWETWVGPVDMAQANLLEATLDVLVIPSLQDMYANLQLPIKLIQAMSMGRAIIASDLPPLRWALGDAGILVSPGDVAELRAGIEGLRGANRREALGRRARRRAATMFSVDVVGPSFQRAAVAAAEAVPNRRARER